MLRAGAYRRHIENDVRSARRRVPVWVTVYRARSPTGRPGGAAGERASAEGQVGCGRAARCVRRRRGVAVRQRSRAAQPAPPFTVTPGALEFPPTQPFASATVPLQLTNTGTTPLTYTFRLPQVVRGQLAVSGCEGPVEPTQLCVANVVFTPTFARSPVSGNLRIEAAGSTIDVPFTLRFTPLAPDPTVPTEVDFGAVRNGTSATQRLTLRNWYVDRADITSVSFPPGSRFAVAATTCTPFVDSGKYCDVDLRYTPGTHVGPDADALTITGPWGAGGATSTETFSVRANGRGQPDHLGSTELVALPDDATGGDDERAPRRRRHERRLGAARPLGRRRRGPAGVPGVGLRRGDARARRPLHGRRRLRTAVA